MKTIKSKYLLCKNCEVILDLQIFEDQEYEAVFFCKKCSIELLNAFEKPATQESMEKITKHLAEIEENTQETWNTLIDIVHLLQNRL